MTNTSDANPRAELLITPQELSFLLSREGPHPLLLDCRAAEEFAAGHLPEAVHLDLWGFSLPDTDDAPLRSFLWMIEHVLALRGVTSDRPVVLYGATSDLRAARVFWFLEYFGHPDVRVLDGGVQAWLAAGFAGGDFDGLRAEVGLPEDFTPVGVIPIGRPLPDVKSPSLNRGWRSLDEFAHWETW